MHVPTIAVVGRPNVGKSALFNRLLGQRRAVVEAESGVTRDRLYGRMEWNGRDFLLVDTGGIEKADGDELRQAVQEQVVQAVHDADVLLLVMDAREGISPQDREVAQLVRQAGKPVVLAVNKVDEPGTEERAWEFFSLGFASVFAVSAVHGHNTGDLLDELVGLLPSTPGLPEDEVGIRIAVVGRPNVGKSSLVNALLGGSRQVVNELPGTTRDAVDSVIKYGDESFVIVDTAGIRRRSRVDSGVEHYSTLRALQAVERCHVALLILDSMSGISEQDQRIGGYIQEAGKGIILVYNKWDLVPKDSMTYRRYQEDLQWRLGFLSYAPEIFVSALTGQRVHRLFPLAQQVRRNFGRRVATGELNRILDDAMAWRPPPAVKGKPGKVFYATQAGIEPPFFLLFVNDPELIPRSYLRYLEKQLRNAADFSGTPLRLGLRRRK